MVDKRDRLWVKSQIRHNIADKLTKGRQAASRVRNLEGHLSSTQGHLNDQTSKLNQHQQVLFSDFGFSVAEDMALDLARTILLEAMAQTHLFIESQKYTENDTIELHIEMPAIHHTQLISRHSFNGILKDEKDAALSRETISLSPIENREKNLEDAMRRRSELMEDYAGEFHYWLQQKERKRMESKR